MLKKFNVFAICLGMVLLVFSAVVQAQTYNEPLSPEQAFEFNIGLQDNNVILFHWKIDPSSYLYRDRIHFKVLSPATVSIESIDYPAGEQKENNIVGHYQVYAGDVTIPVRLKELAGNKVQLQVNYQGCAKAGVCYPPMEKVVTVDFSKYQIETDSLPVSAQDSVTRLLQQQHYFWVFLSFLGFGLLLAFTPCVLPMVPILSGVIVGHSKSMTTGKAFLLSLTYVLAMSVTYAIAGLVVGLLGSNLQAALQSPLIIVLFSLIFVVLACSLFGLFNFHMPQLVLNRIAQWSNRQRGGTYVGVALMGVLATLIVSPCVTPPLIGALAYIAQSGNVILGGLALFAMGLGMGVPLIVLGTLGGKYLPKAGGWMKTVESLFGFLMLAVAIWLIARVIPGNVVLLLWSVLLILLATWLSGYWPRKKKPIVAKVLALLCVIYAMVLIIGAAMGHVNPLKPLSSEANIAGQQANPFGVNFVPVKTVTDVERQIRIAKKEGKPVILDFYAEWCIACKEMDATTLSNPHVRQTLSQFVLLRADVTHNTEADKALEKHYQVVAPPTFIFFDEQGQELRRARLIGGLGPKKFCRHLMNILAVQ